MEGAKGRLASRFVLLVVVTPMLKMSGPRASGNRSKRCWGHALRSCERRRWCPTKGVVSRFVWKAERRQGCSDHFEKSVLSRDRFQRADGARDFSRGVAPGGPMRCDPRATRH